MTCKADADEQILEWLRGSQTDTNSPHSGPLRIAGGWVRCKQLGESHCHDFDIVLTDCSAEAFAKHFQGYVAGLHPSDPRPHVRMLMPDSDKYRALQIAKVEIRVPRVSFDFTTLRGSHHDAADATSCSADCTLKNDAKRRDFTVNALYYNLSTDSIEDPIGTGLQHLAERLLVCCEPNGRTFMDDPVRVLRAARFISGEAEFELAEETRSAAAAPDVLDALTLSTPDDRFRSEIIRMLKLPKYEKGLAFLQTLPGVLQKASALMSGSSAKEWYRKQQINLFIRDYFDEATEVGT